MKLSPFNPAAAAALILLAALPLFAEGKVLRLANNSTTDYTIVLPDTASAVQQTAANELTSFLNQVTGAEFPILTEGQVGERAKNKEKLLVIGPGELSKKLLASAGAEPEETIGQDGIILQTVGNSIVLSGHPERGMLYAVYTFLEDYVGCRWWTSTESTIPARPILDVDVVPISYAPKVTYRETYYLDQLRGRRGGIFSARSKLNGNNNPVPPEYGGHKTFCKFFVHSFYPILPPKDYFDEHPDWYALVDGKRQKEKAQLCLTNPEMKKEFIRNTLAILAEKPNSKIISISQNDHGGWCQCPECQKLVDENGSQAGPLITFVNEVAEAIEREYPDVLVETLAYQQSRFAPTNVKPRDNVLVRLCSIEYSFLTPLADGGQFNQSFVDCIEKWSALSKQLFIWDYVTNFANYMLPHPNLQVLAPNIRFFAKNHAVGIFEQGDAGCAAGDFVRLRDWVIAKLLWNPDLDQRQLENEFLNGYYSPKVGAILREYLDLLTDRALASQINLRCFMSTPYRWLDTPALVKLTSLMNQAITAAREDEEEHPERFAGLADKVERESIPTRLAWLRDWPVRQDDLAHLVSDSSPAPTGNGKEYWEEFRALLEKYQVNTASEGGKGKLDQWLSQLEEETRINRVVPEEVKDLPYDTWYNLEEYEVDLVKPGTWTSREDDRAALNGRTARLMGDHHQWAFNWNAGKLALLRSPTGKDPDEGGFFRVRVILRVRCQATNEDSSALYFGIYDQKRKAETFRRALMASELGKDQYQSIDLGFVQIGSDSLLWISPANHPESVQNVYIDQIVFIRE